MFENYFVKPATVDRLRGSWIVSEIETYLAWLVEEGYTPKTIWRRVPIGYAFGEFACERGAGGGHRSSCARRTCSWSIGWHVTLSGLGRIDRWPRRSVVHRADAFGGAAGLRAHGSTTPFPAVRRGSSWLLRSPRRRAGAAFGVAGSLSPSSRRLRDVSLPDRSAQYQRSCHWPCSACSWSSVRLWGWPRARSATRGCCGCSCATPTARAPSPPI